MLVDREIFGRAAVRRFRQRAVRTRNRQLSRSGHAPQLWPVPVAAATALLVAVLGMWLIYTWLRSVALPVEVPGGQPAVDTLDIIKVTATVAALVGAVLAGVYAYRKQRLAEGDARRADETQLVGRYAAAAGQLGHDATAVRLAGVYAMGRLADDWDEENRQMCVDVLCAYLRAPYEPDPSSPKHREGEREVRRTLIRIIRDHLRPGYSAVSWTGLKFSFEGAVFDCGDLSGANFAGGHVTFHGAKFVSGSFSLSGVQFTDARAWFTGAEFLGSRVSFKEARFTRGQVSFKNAQFRGGSVTFEGAQISNPELEVLLEGARAASDIVQWGPLPPVPALEADWHCGKLLVRKLLGRVLDVYRARRR